MPVPIRSKKSIKSLKEKKKHNELDFNLDKVITIKIDKPCNVKSVMTFDLLEHNGKQVPITLTIPKFKTNKIYDNVKTPKVKKVVNFLFVRHCLSCYNISSKMNIKQKALLEPLCTGPGTRKSKNYGLAQSLYLGQHLNSIINDIQSNYGLNFNSIKLYSSILVRAMLTAKCMSWGYNIGTTVPINNISVIPFISEKIHLLENFLAGSGNTTTAKLQEYNRQLVNLMILKPAANINKKQSQQALKLNCEDNLSIVQKIKKINKDNNKIRIIKNNKNNQIYDELIDNKINKISEGPNKTVKLFLNAKRKNITGKKNLSGGSRIKSKICISKKDDYLFFLNNIIDNRKFDSKDLHVVVTHSHYIMENIIPFLINKGGKKPKNLQSYHVTYVVYDNGEILSFINNTYVKNISDLSKKEQDDLVKEALKPDLYESKFTSCKYYKKDIQNFITM